MRWQALSFVQPATAPADSIRKAINPMISGFCMTGVPPRSAHVICSDKWGSDRAIAWRDYLICGENRGVGLGRQQPTSAFCLRPRDYVRSGIGEAILHDGEARQEREHAQDNRSGLIIHIS